MRQEAREDSGLRCRGGHAHAPQSYTGISPVSQSEKWMGWILPILGKLNPEYVRNSPTASVIGFTLAEFHPNGNFNCYPIVVSSGQFAWGGRVYGSRTAASKAQQLLHYC